MQKKLNDFAELREIKMLRKIGLREDEISYLIWLKSKMEKRNHWK